jgi:hypothetical protein
MPAPPAAVEEYLGQGLLSPEESAAVLDWLEYGREAPDCIPPELKDA